MGLICKITTHDAKLFESVIKKLYCFRLYSFTYVILKKYIFENFSSWETVDKNGQCVMTYLFQRRDKLVSSEFTMIHSIHFVRVHSLICEMKACLKVPYPLKAVRLRNNRSYLFCNWKIVYTTTCPNFTIFFFQHRSLSGKFLSIGQLLFQTRTGFTAQDTNF